MRKKRKLKDRQQVKMVKQKSLKIIEPEAILAGEIAGEDRDLRQAKVAEVLAGFRQDREKRKEELGRFMGELRRQKLKRREAIRKFRQGIRERIVGKKKMMPEVRV